MTEVTRQVRRKTAAMLYSRGRSREVCLIIEPPGTVLKFRLAGERRTVSLSISVAYGLACKAEADSKRAAKKLAREQKRKARS